MREYTLRNPRGYEYITEETSDIQFEKNVQFLDEIQVIGETSLVGTKYQFGTDGYSFFGVGVLGTVYAEKVVVSHDITSDSLTVNGLTVLSESAYLNSQQDANKIATEGFVNSKVSSVYRVKGSVASFSNLPNGENGSEKPVVGDVWNVVEGGDENGDGMNYVYVEDGNGDGRWDKLGMSIDDEAFKDKLDSVYDELKEKTNSVYVSLTEKIGSVYEELEGLQSKYDVLNEITCKSIVSNVTMARKFADPELAAEVADTVATYMSKVNGADVNVPFDSMRYSQINDQTVLLAASTLYVQGATFNQDLLVAQELRYERDVLSVVSGSFTSAIDMSGLFESKLALTKFTAETPNLEEAQFMFKGCENLTTFDGVCPRLTNGMGMFDGCTSLTSFNGELVSLEDGTDMFKGCKLNESSLKKIARTLPFVTENPTITIGVDTAVAKSVVEGYAERIKLKGWNVVFDK